MTAAQLKRLAALEFRRSPLTIRLQREPPVELSFVTAKSYPQDGDYQPVDKSANPSTIIELADGEDLNAVAVELGITALELHRQIESGAVQIVYPPMAGDWNVSAHQPVEPIAPKPIQVWYSY